MCAISAVEDVPDEITLSCTSGQTVGCSGHADGESYGKQECVCDAIKCHPVPPKPPAGESGGAGAVVGRSVAVALVAAAVASFAA